MSEAITSIDINFSTNGSSHQASISSSVADNNCTTEDLGNISATIGEPASVTNSNIANLLRGFILQEETTSKDAIGIKKTRKFIDSLSVKLDSYVLLVRGITCSPTTELDYTGRIYASSQLPPELFYGARSTNFLRGMGGKTFGTSPKIDNYNQYIVLGKTYSVISTLGPPSIIEGVDQAKLIYVYQAQTLKTELSVIDGNHADYGKSFKAAQLKYGYTAIDFFNALRGVGIIVDAPSNLTTNNITLFETSGTLRSCISAITSFFGYYWYVDRNNAGQWYIKCFESSYVKSLSISDLTKSNDPKIISASYTDGGRNTRTVTSFVGTFANENAPNSGPGDTPRQLTKWPFKLVNLDEAMNFGAGKYGIKKEALTPFYTFFCSSYNSDENFDKLVYLALHKYSSFKTSVGTAYNDEVKSDVKGKAETFTKIINTSEKLAKKNDLRAMNFNESASKFYSLQSHLGNMLKTPSNEPYGQILRVYFTYYDALYISNGVTKNMAKGITFTKEAYGPYDSFDYISECPQLSDLVNFLKTSNIEIPTFRTLANNAGARVGEQYYVYLTKDVIKGVDEAWSFVDDMGIFNAKSYLSYLVSQNGADSKAGSAFLNSIAEFSKKEKKFAGIKEMIRLPYANADEDQDSDGTPAEPLESPSYETMKYQVKIPHSNNRIVRSELKTLNGNFQEINALFNYYSNIDIDYDIRSSSATYYDLIIPSFDPTLDSISINVGSDGVTTTISNSNKNIIPPDNTVITTSTSSYNTRLDSRAMSAGAKNLLKLN